MRFAVGKRLLLLLLLLLLGLLLSGCSITEQLIPAIIEERDQVAAEEVIESEPVVLGEGWFSEYFGKINELKPEERLLEHDANLQRYEQTADNVNYAKLLVSSVVLGNEKEHELILSLIGDGRFDELELADEQRFFINKHADSIKAQQQLEEKIQGIVAEKKQLSGRHEKVKKQLLAEKSERTKLENQLKELKSIEASLIHRDLREEDSIQ